ncbi:MAG: RnfABCDGE type electron transport complex subunit D [Gammaproteobacteria bacterium]|nr:RnfABCDGE type electron transport complex subunit D [Gammaproteobacteria bacterium]
MPVQDRLWPPVAPRPRRAAKGGAINTQRITSGAPHVRAVTSLARIQAMRALAIVPVLIAAILNTGYQYLVALDVAGGDGAHDWRDRAVVSFGIDVSDPIVVDVIVAGLVHVLPVLGVALLTGLVWERVFATQRQRRLESGVFVIALIFTLLMPPAVSLIHVVFGMSFATVFGKHVFGGEGKTFLNPALVGAAVMQISFPAALTGHPLWTGIAGYAGTRAFANYHQQAPDGFAWMGIDWWGSFVGNVPGMMGTTSVLAVVLGGAILLLTRIASWRLIGGQLLGMIFMATLVNGLAGAAGVATLAWYWHLVLGSFAFGAVFVATDPASSASTNAGRWIQGFVAGALVVIIRVANPAHPDGVIAALLLASILAPLIDHIAIWFNVRRRAARDG